MKRRLFCAVLVLLLLLSITGCQEKNKMIGTWTGQIDVLQSVIPLLPGSLANLPLGSFPVTVTLTMAEDGTFTMTLSQEDIEKAVQDLWNQAEKALSGNHDTSSGGVSASLGDVWGEITERVKETLMNALKSSNIGGILTTTYNRTGTYQDDGKQLMLVDEGGNTFLSSSYLLVGKKLTLTQPFPTVPLLVLTKK